MAKSTSPDVMDQAHQLWQELTDKLSDVFDAHGAYAIIASQMALTTGTSVVVGVASILNRYYDVWICSSDGQVEQSRWDNARASFQTLIEAGGPLFQEKVDAPAADVINSELWRIAKSSILSVPLPWPGSYEPISPPGILCLIDPGESCRLDQENLGPLAANLTIFIERANLRNQVYGQDIRFSVISDISYSLTSTLSLESIFQQLMDPIRRTLNVESISVGLIDADSGEIEFVDVMLGPLFQAILPVRLQPGQGIAGWVSKHKESVIINDVYGDSRFHADFDQKTGFMTKSMICIPLQVEDRVIGVLQAINKRDSHFNDSDLLMLKAIGGPLAAAIENAQLHDVVLSEKRRIETIFSNMSEGLLTMSGNGQVTNVNDALLTLLQKRADQIIGQHVDSCIRLKKGSLSELERAIVDGDDENPQLAADLVQNERDSVPLLISSAPIRGETGGTDEIIFVFSDLRQIREVERMRDDFFHGIIHELRTPLATILMYARLLREGKAKEKDKANRFLGVIERESDRLQKMVRQMLQLAKMEASEFHRSAQPIQLNGIFDYMLPPLADRATEKGLTFRQNISPDLPPVMGTQEIIDLIFRNLIENAIKFTPSGTVQVRAWLDGDMICLVVKDEGIGIPQESMPNLFGRFFRSQTAVERGIAGTGLGLYMTRESVKKCGGTIQVTSVAGKGSEFTVRLPAIKP